jgi:hypothetical protein
MAEYIIWHFFFCGEVLGNNEGRRGSRFLGGGTQGGFGEWTLLFGVVDN